MAYGSASPRSASRGSAIHRSARYCDGVTRRNAIQAGLAGLIGLSLPEVLRLQAQAAETVPAKKDTSIIYVELAGGPSHFETYDPKPAAPEEYRGPLTSIPTVLPGVQLSQYMVEQARILDKLAVIRSVHHNSGSHGTSSHLTQTGYYLRDNQNRENEMPCMGSITARVRGNLNPQLPSFVSIPTSMRFGRSAWLGKGYNPFETVKNASDDKFEVANLTLIDGLTTERMADRRALLSSFDAQRRTVDNAGVADSIDQFTRKAFEMVTGDAARAAFDVSAESPETRQRYGLNTTGQNLLLARRLVEHGVSYVTIRVNGWDDHSNIAKGILAKVPAFDQGVAALVTDLYERGLDRDVLLVCMGEFGRTPRVNTNAGRDHWGQLMSVMLSGGGLRMGQIIGASDAKGQVPVERPYRPEHVLTMMYRHLGIDPAQTFTDNQGRPRHILDNRGLITELL